ncbi:hypothetical protein EBZ39_00185 [bacterium]|nr:hypothetical protein [bacterium]
MTSSRILFPQFRDEQSASRYPFADHSTLVSDTGLKIENDMFVDASFYGIDLNEQVYLSSITITSQTVTIIIGDINSPARLVGEYDVLNPPDNGVVSFVDQYGRPGGMLLAAPAVRDNNGNIKQNSSLSAFAVWAQGQHNFSADATEFVSTAVIPAKEPGLRALIPDTSQLQTGDVWLVGSNGIVLRAEGEHVIRIDIIGVPLFKRLICAPQTEFPTKSFLQTINGCGPDTYGNFTFTATDKMVDQPTVRIYPNNGTLTFDTVGPQVT